MSGIVDSVFGGGESSTTVVNSTPAPSKEELELIALNVQLAKRQLANIDAISPYQQELIKSSLAELTQNSAVRDAYLKAFPPEQQAAMAAQQVALQKQALDLQSKSFEQQTALLGPQTELQQQQIDLQRQDYALRAKELEQSTAQSDFNKQTQGQQLALQGQGLEISKGQLTLLQQQIDQAADLQPLQKEVLQQQLEQIKNGGRATPEHIAAIDEATNAGISAGTGQIDVQTKRGIGLISDELANSRGLRMTDTPILREATLLTRSADDQKAQLIASMQAAGANAKLNYPLAAQGMTNQVLSNQGGITSAAQSFQDTLAQRAYQNRLALTGSPSLGISLSPAPNPGAFGMGSSYSPASTVSQTSGIGIGLAGINGGGGALDALTRARMAATTQSSNTSTTPTGAQTMSGIGSLAAGIGALAAF